MADLDPEHIRALVVDPGPDEIRAYVHGHDLAHRLEDLRGLKPNYRYGRTHGRQHVQFLSLPECLHGCAAESIRNIKSLDAFAKRFYNCGCQRCCF